MRLFCFFVLQAQPGIIFGSLEKTVGGPQRAQMAAHGGPLGVPPINPLFPFVSQ